MMAVRPPAAWSNEEERMPHVIHRIAIRREGRFMVALAGALCALALAAQPSHAGVLVASAPSCPATETSHPFLPWLDLASYVPAPDGGFQAAATAASRRARRAGPSPAPPRSPGTRRSRSAAPPTTPRCASRRAARPRAR